MIILDGKLVKESMSVEVRRRVRALGFTPTLAIVQIGNLDRSDTYVAAKQKFAESVGINTHLASFSEEVSGAEVLEEIEALNADPSVNGIIVQLPVPNKMNTRALVDAISPEKDVDGLTAVNLKLLLENKSEGFVSATARGILALLDYYRMPIEGKQVVVVGRSTLVGKPTALSFLNRNATVTIAHSHTRNLQEVTRRADILVIAIGMARLIGKEHVSSGQIVLDVGINLADGKPLEEEVGLSKLVGDVDFEAVKGIVNAISPVPGGVGPMTVLSLFENLLDAAHRQAQRNSRVY